MKVWRSLCFNVCTFTNKSEFCFYLKKKCTQEFDFLGNFSRGKSRNVMSGYLSRWRSVPQTSPLEERLQWLCSQVSELGVCKDSEGGMRAEMRHLSSTGTFSFSSCFWRWSPWQEISEKSTASFSCPFLGVSPYETVPRLPLCTLLLWQKKMNFQCATSTSCKALVALRSPGTLGAVSLSWDGGPVQTT